MLLWDVTHTLPDGINNQQFFIKDLPPKAKGDVAVTVRGLAPGAYALTVSQVGYRRNDAYTAYIDMGSPRQITQTQVAALKAVATGKPSQERQVRVGADGVLRTTLLLRENDVVLLLMNAISSSVAN